MLQSCETLITKINDWQQAVLELEKLSDEFLNSGDEKAKERIENKKKEIENQSREYLDFAYPELPSGEKLFWTEKEMLEEITEMTGLTGWYKDKTKVLVKDNHLVKINTSTVNLYSLPVLDFSLFHYLETFGGFSCNFKKFPYFPTSIKKISLTFSSDITKKEKEKIKKKYPYAELNL